MERRDLEGVFETIVAQAGALVGTEHGYLYLAEPGGTELTMSVGLGFFSKLVGSTLERKGLSARVCEAGEPLAIDNPGEWANRLPEFESEAIRAVAAVPLRAAGTVLGVLGLASTEEGWSFEEHELALLARFGQLASLTLDNARLYGAFKAELEERTQAEEALCVRTAQLEVIAEAMAAFLRRGDWREATALLLSGALRQTESEYGFAGVVVEGPRLRILAHEGVRWNENVNREFYEEAVRTYEAVGHLEFIDFDNLFGRVVTSGEAVLSNDAGRDPRAGGIPPGHPPLRSFLGVPFLSGGEVVGVIGVANRPGGYRSSDQEKLELLAQMAAVLYESYRRREREAALEAQLRGAQRMEAIGRLAGGIAHDFNNLLTVILGEAEVLLTRLPEGDPHRDALEQIARAGARGASLTRQLLAFGRKQLLQPRLLDLSEVVSGLEPMLRRALGEDVVLEVDLEPVPVPVHADPGQLEQVLVNLCVNARDAMPEGGTLTIETANVELDSAYARRHPQVAPGSYVMLAVTDTGVGMDADTLAHIFEPFFTTKERGKGTGLGLSTVYGIVKQSGGFIWAYSEPGHGTTLKVYLLRDESGLPTQAHGEARLHERLPGQETVLVVEDEDAVRAIVRDMLEADGYTVMEARDGSEALELGQDPECQIDLLLTDVVMPRMSGPELAQALASRRPGLRVLFTSGYPDRTVRDQGMLEREIDYVQKPFSHSALSRKVREVLDRSGGASRAP